MGPTVLKQSMSDRHMPKTAERIKTVPAMAGVNVRKPPGARAVEPIAAAPAITSVATIRANIRRAARGGKPVVLRYGTSAASAEHEANHTAKRGKPGVAPFQKQTIPG